MFNIPEVKLHTPQQGASLVRRPHLLTQLTEGVNLGRRLTLAEAPPGYGKSTLLAAWLRQGGYRFAWLSLDAGDDDPVRLMAGVVTALARAAGRTPGSDPDAFLASPQPPRPEVFVAYLRSELADIPAPLVLVLDDYHALTSSAAHAIVQALVDGCPLALHIAISTRADPPLPLSRWRASGLVTELRAADLRFSLAESGVFLRQTMGLSLADDAVADLASRSEGWAAGLQLAGLSLRGRSATEVASFVAKFRGSHRFIIDYLADEVLSRQSAEMRRFLTRTAVLERFNAPLCEAVTGRPDSRDLLSVLERANAFLVPLDDQREWYRYHHLFRDVLKSELTDAERLELNRRAATWHSANGMPQSAISYLVAAGETAQATTIVRECAEDLLRSGENNQLLRLLQSLPDDSLRSDPHLAAYWLWSLFLAGRIEAAGTFFASWALPLQQLPPAVSGRIICIRAWIAGMLGNPAVRDLSAEALATAAPDDPICRAAALLLRANVLSFDRLGDDALVMTREAYAVAVENRQPFLAMVSLMDLTLMLNSMGRRREALALCEAGIRSYSDRTGSPLPVTGMCLIQLAALMYDGNRVPEAEECAVNGFELCHQTGFEAHVTSDAVPLLSRISAALGDPDAALKRLRDAQSVVKHSGIALVAPELAALEAELLIAQGNLAAAGRIVVDLNPHPEAMSEAGQESPRVVFARLLIAERRAAEAEQLLAGTAIHLEKRNLGRLLITVHILQALAYQAMGAPERSTAALATAVRAAAPEGYVRLFLDEGERVAAMLPTIRSVAPEFVDTLLSQFAGCGDHTRAETPVLQGGEHLTVRESELLRLLAAGDSNESIAGQLYISLTTAKWHLRNIYGKLGASSRTQAVARARELNLIR